jgi:hypothetical protein
MKRNRIIKLALKYEPSGSWTHEENVKRPTQYTWIGTARWFIKIQLIILRDS